MIRSVVLAAAFGTSITGLLTLEERVTELERMLREGPIVINHAGSGAALTIAQQSSNPCVTLLQHANAAALETYQDDQEDTIVAAGGGDLRVTQVIANALFLGEDGGIAAHVPGGTPKEYRHVLDFPENDVRIGDYDDDMGIRLAVRNRQIRFECNGQLIMTVGQEGVKVYKEAP